MGKFIFFIGAIIAMEGPGLVADVKSVIADHSAEALYKSHVIPLIYARVALCCGICIFAARFLLH